MGDDSTQLIAVNCAHKAKRLISRSEKLLHA